MQKLIDNIENRLLILEFIEETKRRLLQGVEITFSYKASMELQDLVLDSDISVSDIEFVLMNLKTEHYYRGIDPSGKNDFNVCAFCVNIGIKNIEIYLNLVLK